MDVSESEKGGARGFLPAARLALLSLAFLALLFVSGCGGKADDAGTAAAEEITGARKIEQGEDLKNQMRQIQRKREAQEKEARDTK